MNRYQASPQSAVRPVSMALWQSYRRRVLESDRECSDALGAWENEGGSLAPARRRHARRSEAAAEPQPVMH